MKKAYKILLGIAIAAIALIILFISIFTSSYKKDIDVRAVADYIQWFDQPENVVIYSIEKAVFKNTVFYYISRGAYNFSDPYKVDLIVVYYPESNTFQTFFLQDMEYGLHTDIKEQWESREKSARSVHVFTEEEIEAVRKHSIEYLNSLESDSTEDDKTVQSSSINDGTSAESGNALKKIRFDYLNVVIESEEDVKNAISLLIDQYKLTYNTLLFTVFGDKTLTENDFDSLQYYSIYQIEYLGDINGFAIEIEFTTVSSEDIIALACNKAISSIVVSVPVEVLPESNG